MIGHHLAGGGVQVARAGVIAQPFPGLEHVVELGSGQVGQSREATQKAPVIGHDRRYLRLLKHHLADPNPVRVWLIAPGKITPLVVLLTLAARQTIPEELYEAAASDGAGRLRCFFHVTLPLLKPTLVIILIIRTLDAFKVFDVIYVMTRGGPANSTKVLSYYVYEEIFRRYHYGEAAALSVLITILGFVLAFLYLRAARPKELEVA